MNLALLLPAGLAALAALLLPLLIHLARRSERRITDFAALRWLASKPQPQRKHRVEEWWLLLVRLLLIAALALLLARPVLYGQPDRTPWIVAAPGVGADRVRAAAGVKPAHLRWLAPGFPQLDDTPAPGPQPTASVLRELDARLATGTLLTVLVPTVIDGADGERPKLSRRIDWRIVPDSQQPSASTHGAAPTPKLTVRYAKDHVVALGYLRAVGVAWSKRASDKLAKTDNPSPSPVTIAMAGQPLDSATRNLVWLVPGPLPGSIHDWVADGGHALLDAGAKAPELAGATTLWRDADGSPLVVGTTLGRGRIMQLTRPLSPGAMPQLLESDFPEHLRKLFLAPEPAPSRADASAYAATVAARPYPESPRPLAPWLIAAIALLFVVERWLASGPRRGATP